MFVYIMASTNGSHVTEKFNKKRDQDVIASNKDIGRNEKISTAFVLLLAQFYKRDFLAFGRLDK